MTSNNTLTDLNLSLNQIGIHEADCLYLKLILYNNNSIKNLDISNNKIGQNDFDPILLF